MITKFYQVYFQNIKQISYYPTSLFSILSDKIVCTCVHICYIVASFFHTISSWSTKIIDDHVWDVPHVNVRISLGLQLSAQEPTESPDLLSAVDAMVAEGTEAWPRDAYIKTRSAGSFP